MNELNKLLVLYVGLEMLDNESGFADEGLLIGIENRIEEIRPDLIADEDAFRQACRQALEIASKQ